MKKIFSVLTATLIIITVIAQNGDSWQQMQSLGTSANSRSDATGFCIGNKGYIGTGSRGNFSSFFSDFWEYDPVTNTWMQKADFSGGQRNQAIAFNIDNIGYIGFGFYSYNLTYYYFFDLWTYDPNTNTWKLIDPSYTPVRSNASAFAINGKAYIGLGQYQYGYQNDFKEYNPATNAWTQKANFSGGGRSGAVGFSIDNKGYIGTGLDIFYAKTKDFWEYDPITNSWTQKADFGGTARTNAIGFTIGDKGYLGTGYDGEYKNDFWEYDPSTNSWTKEADFSGGGRSGATGISIGNYGYIGFGYDGNDYLNDFWRYNPSDILPLQLTCFTAALQKKNALLNWQTANEVNTSHFNIQRSFNGVNFIAIAKQNAAGNNITQQYHYTDVNVSSLQQSKIYYRLQSIDTDGSAAYSNIAELNVNSNNGITFFIYPNPAKDKLHINISSAENEMLSIRITDMYGREVYAEKISVATGSVNHDMGISKLAKGIYTIQLISDRGVSKSKFVKE